MTLFNQLEKHAAHGRTIKVAVTGAGLIGRGLVTQIERTPGMRTVLIVNRTADHAITAYERAGRARGDVTVTDDPRAIRTALAANQPCVSTRPESIREADDVDVVVEVTGAIAYGADVALHAIESGKHVVMMNAETDATVGCALKRRADEAGVVYTSTDGDQPGVLKRLCDYVQGIGFEVLAAVNCKGFMNVHATPDTIRPWAEKQNTSLLMTTAFTDGTKMNIENAVLANATGLRPEVRGMHGVKTSLDTALDDCLQSFGSLGLVDYTLGGDFGGGVFVIAHHDDSVNVQPLMSYLKMGPGPSYLFFRPYHLCHFETPISIAEAALDHVATIAPMGRPLAEVLTIAKSNLEAGTVLDGVGGYTCYGEIDTIADAGDCLPIGLAEGARLTRAVSQDEMIDWASVELDESSTLHQLYREQHAPPKSSGKAA